MRRGHSPILLLDDILSEMDEGRRRAVLSSLDGVEQILVTGTDIDRFPGGFTTPSALFRVESGAVRQLVSDPATERTGGS
jgi:DNA replication and repair protein RecF